MATGEKIKKRGGSDNANKTKKCDVRGSRFYKGRKLSRGVRKALRESRGKTFGDKEMVKEGSEKYVEWLVNGGARKNCIEKGYKRSTPKGLGKRKKGCDVSRVKKAMYNKRVRERGEENGSPEITFSRLGKRDTYLKDKKEAAKVNTAGRGQGAGITAMLQGKGTQGISWKYKDILGRANGEVGKRGYRIRRDWGAGIGKAARELVDAMGREKRSMGPMLTRGGGELIINNTKKQKKLRSDKLVKKNVFRDADGEVPAKRGSNAEPKDQKDSTALKTNEGKGGIKKKILFM